LSTNGNRLFGLKGGNMRIKNGDPARKFETQDLDGNPLRLADYVGKRLLLSFFRYAS
jgi:peroxiredoxin